MKLFDSGEGLSEYGQCGEPGMAMIQAVLVSFSKFASSCCSSGQLGRV